MAACCVKAIDFIARLTAKEGDSTAALAIKRFAAPAYLVFAVLGSFSLFASAPRKDLPTVWPMSMLVVIAVSVLCFGLSVFSRMHPSNVASIQVLCTTPSVLGFDIYAAARVDARFWAYVVLLLDMGLVFCVKSVINGIVIAATLAYLAVERAEAQSRFGMYEAVADLSDGDVAGCNCARPPCGLDVRNCAGDWFAFAFVCITDYALTRSFAVGQRKQTALVDASITAAERVAELLAAYSVNEAERVVAEDGNAMPDRLRAAFALLLQNLRSYRPYLPDSVCSQEDTPHSKHPSEPRLIDPPGAGAEQADVTLCFTDIQGSTALWQTCQEMYEALQVHDCVIRGAASAHGGYECKTIGDAFMLCFPTAVTACHFALDAQRQLLEQEWPLELLDLPQCAPRFASDCTTLLWKGLRVRIGIHCGSARVQCNPITGRYDYFGHTVNVAARAEASGLRGLICVTDSVLDLLHPTGLSELGYPFIQPLGLRELRGISGRVMLHLMAPQELEERAVGFDQAGEGLQYEDSICLGDSNPSTSSSVSPSSSRVRAVADLVTDQPVVVEGALRAVVPRRAFSCQGSTASRRESVMSPGCGPPSPLGLLTTLRLEHQQATCLTIRTTLLVALEGRLAAHYAAIYSAADNTGGVVVLVHSSGTLVSWNALRSCAHAARGCAACMETVLQDPRLLRSHCGAASGLVLCGNVAAGRRRFATVIGGCVDLSAVLAEVGELSSDRALAHGSVVHRLAAAGSVRRALVCAEHAELATYIVWELRTLGSEVGKGSEAGESLGSALGSSESSDTVACPGGRRSGSPERDTPRGCWDSAVDSALRTAAVAATGAEGGSPLQELMRLAEEFPYARAELSHLVERAERGAVVFRRVAQLVHLDRDL